MSGIILEVLTKLYVKKNDQLFMFFILLFPEINQIKYIWKILLWVFHWSQNLYENNPCEGFWNTFREIKFTKNLIRVKHYKKIVLRLGELQLLSSVNLFGRVEYRKGHHSKLVKSNHVFHKSHGLFTYLDWIFSSNAENTDQKNSEHQHNHSLWDSGKHSEKLIQYQNRNCELGFHESWKPCWNSCSRTWLRLTRSLVMTLIPLWFSQLKTLVSASQMNFSV